MRGNSGGHFDCCGPGAHTAHAIGRGGTAELNQALFWEIIRTLLSGMMEVANCSVMHRMLMQSDSKRYIVFLDWTAMGGQWWRGKAVLEHLRR